jgi:hypothetical protein
MADVHETDLLGKVFFETSPNTGTTTWTDHTATVSTMSLSRGGAAVAVGVSNVEVGSAVISLVDNSATIGVGYWVRVRTLSGNVWAGFVQDISSNFEIINGLTYEIKSLYCVDWVGYAGQVLLENAIGMNAATGTAITTMPYTSDKRVNALNNAFDSTGAALLIAQDGASTALLGHSDQTNSLAGHLDLLANTVGGYWNSTTATPTNATTGRDSLILFSKRTTPVVSGVTFSEASTPFQGLTLGQNTSSISNSVIVRNHGQLAILPSRVAYNADLIYSHEYGAELSASISSYGARQLTVETNLGLKLRTGFVSIETQAMNRCGNPNFEQSIDGWVQSTQCKISQLEPTTFSAYLGSKVLRLRATASTSGVSAEYAPSDTLGVDALGGYPYGIIGYVTKESGTASNHQCQILVEWFDDDENLLGTSTGANFALGADGSWTKISARFTAPLGTATRKAKFRFRFSRSSGANIATGTKYALDNVSFYTSGSASDSYENSGEYAADNNYISFSLGSIGSSESVTIGNSLYTRALAIADDNDQPELCVQTLTWNCQTDLTKVHLLDLNKSVDIFKGVTYRQKIVGIRHEISRNKWITQLELEAKKITI